MRGPKHRTLNGQMPSGARWRSWFAATADCPASTSDLARLGRAQQCRDCSPIGHLRSYGAPLTRALAGVAASRPGKSASQASADPSMVVMRRQEEVTFREVCTHLDVEKKRQ